MSEAGIENARWEERIHFATPRRLWPDEWEKMALRWTEIEHTGEIRLMAAVMSFVIADELEAAMADLREPFEAGSEASKELYTFAAVLGISAEFIRPVILKAYRFYMTYPHASYERTAKSRKKAVTA